MGCFWSHQYSNWVVIREEIIGKDVNKRYSLLQKRVCSQCGYEKIDCQRKELYWRTLD